MGGKVCWTECREDAGRIHKVYVLVKYMIENAKIVSPSTGFLIYRTAHMF
jgi:hypothetical protein